MSGTQMFIIALVLIVGVLALLFVAQWRQRPAKVGVSVGKFVSATIELSADARSGAVNAVEEAAKARGQSGSEAAEQVRSDVASLEKVPLTQVLWVDDHPDNNVYENLALMNLGFAVTTATSNQAAYRYLAEWQFDLVVTDIARDSTQDDGRRLVSKLHVDRPDLPVVVYTLHADRHRGELVAAGAAAVEDAPALLVRALLAGRSQTAGSAHGRN